MRAGPGRLIGLLRRRGRSAVSRAVRMTAATVTAFVVAELCGLHRPPPLLAALTALLVVQATLTSTLLHGVQRVVSVVAGVALAVLFVAVVGLTWWSLAALVAVSILVGQLLRLGPHLVEVPISAMLVLGVGASGAETAGGGRILETLIGAAVGMLVNVVVPPAVRTRYAGQAVEKFAGEIAGLLGTASAALLAGPVTAEQSAGWLQDARRLNRHVPRLDRALAEAEESRRLNVRALASRGGDGMRAGLDALEYTSVSLRTLFRAVDDATRERTGVADDVDHADAVRRTAGSLLARMGTVVHEFGGVLTAPPGGPWGLAEARLAGALAALEIGRTAMADLLLGDPRNRAGLWELNAALVTAVDRMLDELGPAPAGSPPPVRRPEAAQGS